MSVQDRRSYRVFKRSALNFEQFSSARKFTVERGLTYDEAQRLCRANNAMLSPAQVRKGTKYEFEQE